MAQKKDEQKKGVKVQDLAPKKDAKGGAARNMDGGSSLDRAGSNSMQGGKSLDGGSSLDGSRNMDRSGGQSLA
jgi:hypothetical protein